jgi:hypothetical protein
MREQARSAERPIEEQSDERLNRLYLDAFVDCRPMPDFDDHHNDELVFANFIDYSVDSLSNPIPFLH